MTENLLTPSVIKLFGRVMTDLKFDYDPRTVVIGYNNLLQRQLANGSISVSITGVVITNPSPPPAYLDTISNVSTTVGLSPGMSVSASYPPPAGSPAGTPSIEVFSDDAVIWTVGPGNSFKVFPPPINGMPPSAPNISIVAEGGFKQKPKLARIYGFSFEGAYYGLPKPSIFLVHGTGTPAGNWAYPSTVEQSGVAAREWDFSGPTGYNAAGPSPTSPTSTKDIFYWEYEKGDFSIRFDTEAGPFEQILLVATLRAGADMADRATPRSGASLSGASLAGASLSGASLSGASLSGASLSGASLRGR